MKFFNLKDYGKVQVRFVMIDEGTILTEGVEIKSLDNEFELIEIFESIDIDELSKKDVTKLIENRF